jgi:hypothetical protein
VLLAKHCYYFHTKSGFNQIESADNNKPVKW